MPEIISSADLRDRYDEISALCRERLEPIFITEDGKDGLAVMSIAAYGRLREHGEFYELVQEGLNGNHGDIHSLIDAVRNTRGRLFARALKEFQDAMAGEAERVGFYSEEDVAEWIAQSRREEDKRCGS